METIRTCVKNFFYNLFKLKKLNLQFKTAFTIAEVLIALGIIGIIAEVTIPVIVVNQQKQSTTVKLEKAYTVMGQAFLNAESTMGQSQSWDPPALVWDSPSSRTWWNNYLLQNANFSAAKICTTHPSDCTITGVRYLDGAAYASGYFDCSSCGGCYLLNDGTTFVFSGVGASAGDIFVDINGKSGPNIWGKDIFYMSLNYQKGYIYFPGQGLSRATLLSDATHMCNKQATANTQKGFYCGNVIQTDGWQIKTDYPW